MREGGLLVLTAICLLACVSGKSQPGGRGRPDGRGVATGSSREAVADAPAARVRATKGSVVKVVKTARGFQLLRNGKPYFIQGVGGEKQLSTLKAAGGNSVRTWGAENQEPLLDEAASLGLTVTVGIWLGHERHGFRYDDPKQVAEQQEKALAFIRRYKEHPALLIWGLGNEMEGRGDNPAIWKAVNDLAKRIKVVDPNHPTMTVVAEVGGRKIQMLRAYCPDIDLLGINSYGGLASLPRRLKEQGWDRPYVVTEFGPLGPWEVGKTSWGAPIEATSTQKATTYLTHYERSIAEQRDWCLGSYAFLWGHKQEATATWFGMLLPNGERLGAVEAMTFAWTGRWPANRAPQIRSLTTEADGKEVAPASRLTASVDAADPDGDPLAIDWEVRSESSDRKQGGDRESAPPAHPAAILSAQGSRLVFQAPAQEGAYRLFVTVHDGKGNAATANVPFFVK